MRYLYWLLLFVPVAGVLGWWLHAPATWVFLASAAAIVPLSGVLGRATEEMATHTGPTIGGLLNASLGNAAELIITVVALRAGLIDLVKASITGSIIGNLLLVLGVSLFAGGVMRPTLRFNKQVAGVASSMMALSVTALVIPSVVEMTHPARSAHVDLSVAVATVLIVIYAASLLFTLRTHARLLAAATEDAQERPQWSVRRAAAALALATVGVAAMSELLVGATEAATRGLGLTQLFVGIIVVPLVGNASEHASAVWMAMKNKTDLAFGIAINSSMQVALFVAPVLVFVALALGRRMNFVFTPLEVLAVAAASAIVSIIARDGESNWFEGAQLVAVYLILAAAFFFY
ncbi:MAG TPA: calcium/proton exchanger [Coriobacteriia bacterium]